MTRISSPRFTFLLAGFSLCGLLLVDAFLDFRFAGIHKRWSHQRHSTSLYDKSQALSQKKLSRPERKALERKKKQQAATSKRRKPQYTLNSTAISVLDDKSTSEEILRAIKRAQDRHDHNDLKVIEDFLLKETEEGFAYGYRGSLLSRLAVAALHIGSHELARRAIETRRVYHRNGMRPMESAAILRGLLRVHNVTDAVEVLDDELALPLEGASMDDPLNREKIKYRALSLGSIASRHFFEGEPVMAVNACEKLSSLGAVVRSAKFTPEELEMPWQRIITGAAQCESKRRNGLIEGLDIVDKTSLPCNLVYSVLAVMTTFPSVNDNVIFEALSNALVRRVVFVTGAVSMDGCPAADRGEAVFIGRSNVGKSSLVNMLTNRKSLAYTSKTPGKTQQFNFFAVNDKPELEREIRYGDSVEGNRDEDSFYIVDLPGFGFAKVPEQQRLQWKEFMADYLTNRRSLKVVFHLVDSRHGLIDEDEVIMRQVSQTLPRQWAYVVLLTKADKNVKKSSTKKPGKVAGGVLDQLRRTMNQHGLGGAPVILTSAETKLGRDEVWRYLRLAAER